MRTHDSPAGRARRTVAPPRLALSTRRLFLLASLGLAGCEVAPVSDAPTVVDRARAGTTLLDDHVYVDASQYGNARHVVEDRYGHFVMAYVDVDPVHESAIVLSHSKDGQDWVRSARGLGTRANRPALAYDPASDRLHLVHQAGGREAASDVVYRRFRPEREANGGLRGLVEEGALRLEAGGGSRPTVAWTRNGGDGGSLLAAWTFQDGHGRGEVRVTTRVLRNDATDFAAAGWRAPDGRPDGFDARVAPRVGVDVIDSDEAVSHARVGLVCLAVAEATEQRGPELHAVYSLFGASSNAWRWRSASWNALRGDWSEGGGWAARQRIVTGHFGRGRPEKQLTGSCLHDPGSDSVWLAAAHHERPLWPGRGDDVISLFRLSRRAGVVREAQIYRVAGGASRHPMTSIALDASTGLVWVAYVTGDANAADGHVVARAYQPGGGLRSAAVVYADHPSNYPNLVERARNSRLLGIFRENTAPQALRLLFVEPTSAAAGVAGERAASTE
jgi:hypothetical protein